MKEKLDEKESEVLKYLPKKGTPAFAIVRALQNEIPHCLQKDELKEAAQPFCTVVQGDWQLVRLGGNHDFTEKENYFEVQKRVFRILYPHREG